VSATIGTCGWCERSGREVRQCCERGDHRTLVCVDSRDCLRATQATLREQEVRETAWLASQPAPRLKAISEPSAELSARRTAGDAVLADFGRWERGEIIPGDWRDWAYRLAAELRSLIGWLSDDETRPLEGRSSASASGPANGPINAPTE